MGRTTIANAIGKGVLAGLVGTAAMTVSSTIEMRVRGRKASTAPAVAAARVLGIEKFSTDAAERRFGTMVHWGYGTGWGLFRGLLGATGMPFGAATAAHAVTMWGSEQVLLPTLDVAPPLTEWGSTEIVIDAWHHLVHVAATLLAYRALDRSG